MIDPLQAVLFPPRKPGWLLCEIAADAALAKQSSGVVREFAVDHSECMFRSI